MSKKLFIMIILSLCTAIYPQQSQVKIGLVHSEFSVSNDKTSNQPSSIAWEYFLLNNKIKYEVLLDEDISSDDLSDFDMIILPDTRSISDEAFENLTKYIQRHGSVWMLGNTGEIDEKAKSRDISFSEFILGSPLVTQLAKDKYTTNLNFTADELITPSEILHSKFLLSFQRNIFASTANRKSYLLGYYDKDDNFKSNNITAGMIATAFGSGRVLWFGFQLDQLIGKNDQRNFKIFFDSAINWLANKPYAQINYLPGTLSSYKIISAIINDKESLNRIPDDIKPEEGRVNLFIRPENYSNLIQEIGFDIPQYTYNIFVTLDELTTDKFQQQLDDLSQIISLLRSKNDQPNCGLFVDGIIEDLSSLQSISKSGITFIFDRSNFFILDDKKHFKLFPAYNLIEAADLNFKYDIPLELNSERIYNYLLVDDHQTLMNRSLQQYKSAAFNKHLSQIGSVKIESVIEFISAVENINLELLIINENSFDVIIGNNNRFNLDNLSFKLFLPEGTNELNYEMTDDNILLSKLKYQNQYLLRISPITSKQKIKLSFSYETNYD